MTITLRRLAATSVTALCALALNTGIAHASIGVIGEFGETGPGALQANQQVATAEGIAVNPVTGDVYVTDGGHYRVVEFSSTGEFIMTFGKDVNKTKVEEGAGEAEENVCTAVSGDQCQAGMAGTSPGQFGELQGVAVSAVNGDVYVADGGLFSGGNFSEGLNPRIEKFSAAGSYISEIESGAGGILTFQPWGIAVDLEDNLYVNALGQIFKFFPEGLRAEALFVGENNNDFRSITVDPSGFIYISGGGPVIKMNPAGEPVGTLNPEGGQGGGALAMNLATGEVFSVVGGTNEILQYTSSGSLVGRFPSAGNALAYGTSIGKLYQRAGNRIVVYGTFPLPPPGAPAVGRESDANLGETTAVVDAQVDPHSLDTAYEVRYGTSPTLAGAASAPVSPADAGSGFLGLPVSVALSGLQPSARYYYQVVAHNSFGGGAGSTGEGPIQSFITLPPPPTIAVGQPVVGTRSATLNGAIVPGSVGLESDTRWCVQYGQTTTYEMGFLPQVVQNDLGEGTSGVPVSVQLSNLRPDTTYHYRLVAINGLAGENLGSVSCQILGGQEVVSPDHTFTTSLPLAPVVDTGVASEVSQNSASVSGTVDPGGSQAFYEFDLGTDTTYGSRVFGEVGSQTGAQSVTVSFGVWLRGPFITIGWWRAARVA